MKYFCAADRTAGCPLDEDVLNSLDEGGRISMEERFTEDMVKKALDHLPQALAVRLQRIPVPERGTVLEDAAVPLDRMGPEMEEDDIRALDKALRYKDAKIQLVRMVLITRIKNDVQDSDVAEEMAAHILSQHPADRAHGAYDDFYRGKGVPSFSA